MTDFILALPEDAQILVCILGTVGTVAVLIVVPSVLAYHWRHAERDRRAAELAAELIAAGFSPAEIRDTLATAFPAADAREETVRRAIMMGQNADKVRDILNAGRAEPAAG